MLACIPELSYAEKKIHVDHDTTSDPSGPKRGSETGVVTIGVDEDYLDGYDNGIYCLTIDVGDVISTNTVTIVDE